MADETKEGRRCPDDGTCHHDCGTGPCWRKANGCAALGPTGRWPGDPPPFAPTWTPGPYAVRRRTRHGSKLEIVALGSVVVATVHAHGSDKGESNGALLASAPRLYAACVELIRGDGTADSLQRAIDLARVGLAAAEGPPPELYAKVIEAVEKAQREKAKGRG